MGAARAGGRDTVAARGRPRPDAGTGHRWISPARPADRDKANRPVPGAGMGRDEKGKGERAEGRPEPCQSVSDDSRRARGADPTRTAGHALAGAAVCHTGTRADRGGDTRASALRCLAAPPSLLDPLMRPPSLVHNCYMVIITDGVLRPSSNHPRAVPAGSSPGHGPSRPSRAAGTGRHPEAFGLVSDGSSGTFDRGPIARAGCHPAG
ncbi:hypothetical protein GCM10010236_54060 [Streptomyces eurythermus]|nr:hypothetical protein GCM10010236_54060 [Streptomyces eurythermus]